MAIFEQWRQAALKYMKDHVEISHLTKFHASRVNRDQVIDLEKKNINNNIFYSAHTDVNI